MAGVSRADGRGQTLVDDRIRQAQQSAQEVLLQTAGQLVAMQAAVAEVLVLLLLVIAAVVLGLAQCQRSQCT